MYEKHFGLARRPFIATPDPSCFLSTTSTQAVFDELVVVAEQNLGIGILTAAAGVGKTLFCERIAVELRQRFKVIFLRHAKFANRKALLQTLLHELQQPYHQTTEQELRLVLGPALREQCRKGAGVVIIADEAHELAEPMLEELRTLTDLAEDGKAFVRLILSGQPQLEERLTQPSLSALNQRVGAHLMLSPLTQQEAGDYIDYRLTWAGGRTIEILSVEAIRSIVDASEGVPRCLNQLCDHSLLSAFVAEEKPVSAQSVGETLQELRHLPLHFHQSSTRDSVWESPETAVIPNSEPELAATYAFQSGTTCVEIGSDTIAQNPAFSKTDEDVGVEPLLESLLRAPLPEAVVHQMVEARSREAVRISPSFAAGLPVSKVGPDGFHEAEILDRYALLDAGKSIPDDWSDLLKIEATSPIETQESFIPSSSGLEAHDSSHVSEAERPLMSHWDQPLPWINVNDSPAPNAMELDMPRATAEFLASEKARFDLATNSPWEPTPAVGQISASVEIAEPVSHVVETAPMVPQEEPPRGFRNLFTRLRQKQRHAG